MTDSRLVKEPILILSGIRSGSTLLRCVLGSHSLIYAPHELHLTGLGVQLNNEYAAAAMGAAGLDTKALQHMLWDRILHALLADSGKQIIVEKTPGNARAWQRLTECWPNARFVFLLRDPADMLTSALDARPDRNAQITADIVLDLIEGVQQARIALRGHEIRYEHLVADPQGTIMALCDFLDVSFEPQMLSYEVPQSLVPGIGDFTDKIRLGRIVSGRHSSPLVHGALAHYRKLWGYGDA